MKYKQLLIEKKEYVLLKRYVNLSAHYHDATLWQSIQKLLTELDSAKIVDEAEMQNDVVRFHSIITVTSENGWSRRVQLVLPPERDVSKDKISILTPMGIALFGYAEGDTVSWEFPSGPKRLRIEKVEQEPVFIDTNLLI
ncbi:MULTISPECIES: GreA/GreB family elongation factor [Robiginitalea]|uniref:Nucleoside diphosphate kinase regulator n=1 Tax=Robiginitalea biformata (strain ATCC BAA-864 / DSM 15991 / KCTC 12146 / HTCC2501) TaxID=313596 RepID=A4CMB9_ROBBH|nr:MULTISPECIES: GreA/GreB family elongation factor [Robiginitalea]EAR14811.1 nucleoside diphosphate kinase regulator [Robiginitalea biformata HTCC2501]MDC6355337.1 GreA/GreB family elongation factor [Robiginitalea sp. PM2]MDC6375448.1 GreA/GreB family elongation factor [Robiginitalea sp. SP8]